MARRSSERAAHTGGVPTAGFSTHRSGGSGLSRTALVAAALFLAVAWTAGPHHRAIAQAAFFVSMSTAAWAGRGGSRRAPAWVALAAAAMALHWAVDGWGPALPLSYPWRLTLEAAAGLLVVAVGALILAASTALPRGHRRPPVPSIGIPMALLVGGAVARGAGAWLIQDYPGGEAAIRYALRVDLATALWGAGALAMAAGMAYSAWAGVAPSRKRAVGAALAVALVFSFVGYTVGTALAAKAEAPQPSLLVGAHATDLSHIPPGFDPVAHLEVAWDRVERREGVRNWSHVDGQVRYAETHGIQLYLLASVYPPQWFLEKHPDAAMVDADGDPFLWIDADPRAPRERVWDVSFHHPAAREQRLEFTREVAARYGDSPAVRYVAVQNEPTYPVGWNPLRVASYDPFTAAAFRESLRSEYGAVEAMNAELGTDYGAWWEVEPPVLPLGDLWHRWQAFREDALATYVEELVAAAREETVKPVTVKVMAHFMTRYAVPRTGLSESVVQRFVAASDVVSVDLYPVSYADLERSLTYFHGLADGKPLVVAEFNTGLGAGAPTSGARLARHLALMDQYAEVAIIFTVSDHFLYGTQGAGDHPAVHGVRLFKRDALDPGLGSDVAALLWADVRAVPTLYTYYALASAAAGVPAAPWPLVVVLVAPVPTRTRRGAGRVGLVKLAAVAACVALALLPAWGVG